MAQVYKFYSSLPPERVPDILSGEWQIYDRTTNAGACIRSRWSGRHVTVTRTTVRRYTAQDGWIPSVYGLGWSKGRRTDWQWNNPFRGEVSSDGRGGSVLTGRFHIHPAGKLLFAIFPLIGVYSLCFLSPHHMETLVAAIIAAALYLRHLIHACRAIDSHDGVEEILRFLREHFEEVGE